MTLNSDLTQEKLKEVLSYDPETGVFTWVKSRPGVRAGSRAGNTRSDGYVRIGVHGKIYMAHRLAWLFMTGEFPEGDIDHKDGNGKNNRFGNLRDVPTRMNVHNQHKKKRDGKHSPYIGVGYHKRDRLWRARILANGKRLMLGYFATPELARDAYIAAKERLHDGYIPGVSGDRA